MSTLPGNGSQESILKYVRSSRFASMGGMLVILAYDYFTCLTFVHFFVFAELSTESTT